MSSEKVGYGLIRVSFQLGCELTSKLHIDRTTTQGELRDRGIFADCHTALHLPESYKIFGIFVEPYRLCWSIVVESPEIPIADEGTELPHCTPIYRRNKHGDEEFVRIEVEMAHAHERVLRVD